ncbi:MAG: tetratricopeptide repeat protein, partial [Ignavibacteria bacterium]|nr:tetratricopeptide repeat protein [Ignavibacteria bacterium]
MLGRCFIPLCFLVILPLQGFSQPLPKLAEEQDYTFCIGLFKEGQYQLALDQLRQFVRTHPSSSRAAEARFLTAESLFYLGQYDHARKGYEQFILDHPGNRLKADASFRLGEIAFRLESYPVAISRFSEVLQEYPDRDLAGEAAYWLGESYYKSGNQSDAFKFYRISQNQYPGNSLADYAIYSQGWILKERGDFDPALTMFRTLIRDHPESGLRSAADIRIGECLFQSGKYQETIDELSSRRQGLTDSNEKAEADYLIAESYFSLRDYPSALQRYELFLDEHSGHRLEREIRYSLGWTFLIEQNYAKAVGMFRELSSGNDEIAQASAYRQGIALKLDKRATEAAGIFSEIMQRWPSGPYADNALFELAVIDFENRNYKDAQRRFHELTTRYSDSDVLAESYRMFGETYLAVNDYGAAREAFRKASEIKNAPADVVAEAMFQEGWSAFRLRDH